MAIKSPTNIAALIGNRALVKFYPSMPKAAEGYMRCVHITSPTNLDSIFANGLNLTHGLIDSHTRPYSADTKLSLVHKDEQSPGLFAHPKTGDPRYRNGVAVIIDLPFDVYQAFRRTSHPDDTVPKEFIRGAVTRHGQWINNPNYKNDFVYEIPAPILSGPANRIACHEDSDTLATVKLLNGRAADDIW